MVKARQESQALAAENLVLRARQGDQNAMAIICLVRKQASRNGKARHAFKQIHQYIKENPPTNSFGQDVAAKTRPVVFRACIELANGPPLTNSRIEDIAASFGEEKERKLFLFGVVKFRNGKLIDNLTKKVGAEGKPILELAKSVGTARSIQNVRRPNSVISNYSPMVGWELGE
jgi:hypothetical protein